MNGELLAKLLKARGSRHSGQAKRDPESRIFEQFCPPEADGFRRNDGLSDLQEALVEAIIGKLRYQVILNGCTPDITFGFRENDGL